MRSCEALEGLLSGEAQAVGRRFVAPCLRAGSVRTCLQGLAWTMRVADGFEGWGIFRIQSRLEAALVRTASVAERLAWAKGRPRATCIVLCDDGTAWDEDRRQPVRLSLLGEARQFDLVRTARDGDRCWSLGRALDVHPSRAHRLRSALAAGTAPHALGGLRRDDALLYATLLRDRSPHERMAAALRLGGAELMELTGDRVRWRKGAREFVTVVRPDLTVASAGFCLSDRDAEHDLSTLASLVGRVR